ncbi:MAG: homocysteine S-methyltransferase, partial [Paracoccaceae bacterium]
MALDHTSTLLTRFGDRLFLTDAGLETSLIFHDGIDLPHFASFPLLRTMEGRQALARYFNGFLDEAAALDLGFVLDTVTWRASHGWGAKMGWSADDIDGINREAVMLAQGLRAERAGDI